MRKTKIICTLGPASCDRNTIKEMVLAGMDVARLNFSHGDYSTHEQNIRTIREVSAELNKPIAIIQDLQGPKIRVGEMEPGVVLHPGDQTIMTMLEVLGNAARFSSTYKGLADDVKEGDSILIDDGLICIQADRIYEKEIYGTVIYGGPVNSHKGINLQYSSISAPAMTPKDIEDLNFGLDQNIDYVALSFVREASDIKEVKGIINSKDKTAHVIAKIERHEALNCLDEIVETADVVMVARGDLGVEIPLERVPTLQKSILQACRIHQKPVIVATQMLESMIHNPRPTRAEVSDIANAIYDGADALMLSGETAVGTYPIQSVKTMSLIAETAEAELISSRQYVTGIEAYPIGNSVVHAACQLAQNLHAKAILCFTEHGFTARLLSKYRQSIPAIAVTTDEFIQRRIALYWGLQSLQLEEVSNTDEMIVLLEKTVLEQQFVEKGDLVVIIAGLPLPITGVTNLIKVHRIGESYAV
ncbi:pyruvate kinase [Phormidium pseudopriestleyi FRX01]|uniref:Pyruvate kinase n=1 Tax=Phormidium pseudopriestleyi FRX01 TaxID=1759528 RepID=A0ABS3FNT8_9CYAN|nr:pyruvate kinase [Phormidium pseudopriestleyi]MBO0348790.1 pyruvate kinase [Phormidium pseudopriestleyi FRX01]